MMQRLTPVIKNLIIINVLVLLSVFIVGYTFNINLNSYLAIHYWDAAAFKPYQLITAMFAHSESFIFHIIFNMYTLYILGTIVEYTWGSKRFLFYYLACGIGASIFWQLWDTVAVYNAVGTLSPSMLQQQSLLPYHKASLGASGAVSGVLMAFAAINPNTRLRLLFPPISFTAKNMAIVFFIFSLVFSVVQTGMSIDHVAHLGGCITGLILLFIWRKL